MKIVLTCGKPGHNRDIARFTRNSDGQWEAQRGGSWTVEERGTDVLSENAGVDPETGRKYRATTKRPARDRWFFYCLTCEHNRDSQPVVVIATKLDVALATLEARGQSRTTLENLREFIP